jgi:RNA-directed DNA polymerase
MKDDNSVSCAASHPQANWHEIDWNKANQEVRRMQARIVEATKAGRWGKVRALQHLLTHSFYAKALAVRRTTENQGKKTPGVDGTVWDTPQAKAEAITSLKRHGYKPKPLRRVYIPKKNGKMRPLGIPTMKDRAMQALYLLALEPVAETTGDTVSYGFRPKRSCADAIEQCFVGLSRGSSAQWVLEGDIKACFDGIDHEWLETNVPMDKTILHKWLKAGYVEESHLFPTETGTPQGGIISPTLANIALDGLESLLKTHWGNKSQKVHLIRYADDFIITGVTKEILEAEIKPAVEKFLLERGLTLSPEKTLITHISEGFDFLGQNIRKYPTGQDKQKLLIKPSKTSVKRFLDEIRETIRQNPTMPAAGLIRLLNPKIRGWALYHRSVVSRKTFETIDHEIHKALWAWATRLHKNKGQRWIKQRYWRTIGKRRWVFASEGTNREGKKTPYILFKASDVNIKRHVKIQNAANPYDRQWEMYFERRAYLQTLSKSFGQALTVLKQQGGKCPVCKQMLDGTPADFHLHHIIPIVRGGNNRIENLVFVHPNCHRQLHWLSASEAALPSDSDMKGLSRVRGNSHARFLGGEYGSNVYSLSD